MTPDKSDAETSASQATLEPDRVVESRWRQKRGWVTAVVLLPVLATFWLLGGLWGVVAWTVVAASWLVFPPIVAVGVGQFALVALSPADAGLTAVLPGEATLLGLLVVDIVTTSRTAIDGGGLIGVATVAGGGVLLLEQALGLLAAIIGLLLGVGLVSYLLHRYLLLELGHLTDRQPRSET